MECPKCKYNPTMREIQASPDVCPSCGVVYAKVMQAKSSSESKPVNIPKKKFVSKAKRIRAAINGEFIEDNAQLVVVTDIRMRFWSMVLFMVKWALASIPAMMILALIFVGLVQAIKSF